MNIKSPSYRQRHVILCVTFLITALIAGPSFPGEKTPEGSETERTAMLNAIKSTGKAEELKTSLESPDKAVRSAAISRLGEIGGPEAVKLLHEAFREAPRVRGTNAGTSASNTLILPSLPPNPLRYIENHPLTSLIRKFGEALVLDLEQIMLYCKSKSTSTSTGAVL